MSHRWMLQCSDNDRPQEMFSVKVMYFSTFRCFYAEILWHIVSEAR